MFYVAEEKEHCLNWNDTLAHIKWTQTKEGQERKAGRKHLLLLACQAFLLLFFFFWLKTVLSRLQILEKPTGLSHQLKDLQNSGQGALVMQSPCKDVKVERGWVKVWDFLDFVGLGPQSANFLKHLSLKEVSELMHWVLPSWSRSIIPRTWSHPSGPLKPCQLTQREQSLKARLHRSPNLHACSSTSSSSLDLLP